MFRGRRLLILTTPTELSNFIESGFAHIPVDTFLCNHMSCSNTLHFQHVNKYPGALTDAVSLAIPSSRIAMTPTHNAKCCHFFNPSFLHGRHLKIGRG